MRLLFRKLLTQIVILKSKLYNPAFSAGRNCRINFNIRICGGGKIDIGNNVALRDYAILSPGHGYIKIGNNCAVGAFNYFDGNAGLTIGNDVHIGQHVCIYTADHIFSDNSIPIHKQGLDFKPVVIEDDVWIGAHAVVLAGVTVSRGSVIAAGAIVTRDIPENSIVAGVPAKVIKNRV